MGDGVKLLTYLNSALKALLGFDIFPRVPKKKVKFCCLVLLVETCSPHITLCNNKYSRADVQFFSITVRILALRDAFIQIHSNKHSLMMTPSRRNMLL